MKTGKQRNSGKQNFAALANVAEEFWQKKKIQGCIKKKSKSLSVRCKLALPEGKKPHAPQTSLTGSLG